jgi:hypothetical protein
MATSKIVKKIYKDWQEYLIFWSWWASIEVDSALSDSSENPVQNKVVKGALDNKITNPSGWSTWQVLKKTPTGSEWWDTPKTYTTIQVILTSAWWSNNEQTVTATWVTTTNSVVISPDPSSFEDYTWATIYCSAQATNSLTFTCSDVPSNDITVNVMIFS